MTLFVEIFSGLKSIKVNRNVFVNVKNDSIVKRGLHGLDDASLRAYGAAIYVGTSLKSRKVLRDLFTAKSCIGPLKEITMPCLKLLGHLILARLMHSVKIARKKGVQNDGIY